MHNFIFKKVSSKEEMENSYAIRTKVFCEEQKISNFATFLKISENGKIWLSENSDSIQKSFEILKKKFYQNIQFKKKVVIKKKLNYFQFQTQISSSLIFMKGKCEFS